MAVILLLGFSDSVVSAWTLILGPFKHPDPGGGGTQLGLELFVFWTDFASRLRGLAPLWVISGSFVPLHCDLPLPPFMCPCRCNTLGWVRVKE